VNFRNKLIFYGELLAQQPGGPPLVGCVRLHIQYIRSYPTYLEAVSSIRNLRKRHAVVTRDPPNMVWIGLVDLLYLYAQPIIAINYSAIAISTC
jgi:hypothetical protein